MKNLTEREHIKIESEKNQGLLPIFKQISNQVKTGFSVLNKWNRRVKVY